MRAVRVTGPPTAPLAASRAARHDAPGRILRLKCGHNPNSSSIGTLVFAMPAALLGITIAFGAAAGLLAATLLPRREDGPKGEADRSNAAESPSPEPTPTADEPAPSEGSEPPEETT